jgi:hypothetical protein
MGFIAKSNVCFDVDIMFYQLFTDKDIYEQNKRSYVQCAIEKFQCSLLRVAFW